MSNYNTKLQSNNIDLQTVIQTLQNKAVNPDTTDATATANDILSGKTAYVNGQKITGNIAFAPARTITPSATNQIAVSSGYYTGGNITVAGDSNLVADNIKKGTSIFGVIGNYEGNGEVDYSIEDSLVDGTVSIYTNDRVTKIKNHAFSGCKNLTSANFPICLSIGDFAFYACKSLTSVSFPVCSYIGNYAFAYCSSLTSVSFPVCSYIGNYAFSNCTRLTSADFGGNSTISKCTIYQQAFAYCSKLTNLTLRYSFVVTLSNINAFISTPLSRSTLTGSFGSIYVPASLVDSYKAATNWATYADRITAIAE